jgi:hypothetical protein
LTLTHSSAGDAVLVVSATLALPPPGLGLAATFSSSVVAAVVECVAAVVECVAVAVA